jgi:hypothetical protein
MFQESNKDDTRKSTELLQQKSEISYHVPPSTRVSNERLSVSKNENISDEDEASITTDSITNSVIEKKPEKFNEQIIQVKIYLFKPTTNY